MSSIGPWINQPNGSNLHQALGARHDQFMVELEAATKGDKQLRDAFMASLTSFASRVKANFSKNDVQAVLWACVDQEKFTTLSVELAWIEAGLDYSNFPTILFRQIGSYPRLLNFCPQDYAGEDFNQLTFAQRQLMTPSRPHNLPAIMGGYITLLKSKQIPRYLDNLSEEQRLFVTKFPTFGLSIPLVLVPATPTPITTAATPAATPAPTSAPAALPTFGNIPANSAAGEVSTASEASHTCYCLAEATSEPDKWSSCPGRFLPEHVHNHPVFSSNPWRAFPLVANGNEDIRLVQYRAWKKQLQENEQPTRDFAKNRQRLVVGQSIGLEELTRQ